MNKVLIALATTAAASAAMSAPALAGGVGTNSIGPFVSFGGGSTSIGVNGKFGIADHISIRPFVDFPSGGTSYGGALTYDFDLRDVPNQFTPYLGVGFAAVNANGGGSASTGYATAGLEFPISRPIELKASVDVPFSSGFTTSVNVGASFRF